MSYQKVIIVGNLGRDPEMRYMSDGTPVTNFSVATTRKWKNPDGSQSEETTWFRVAAWRRQAEIAAQYLSKGSPVMVEGRMTPDKATGGPRIWTGQDGTPLAIFEILADRVILLGSRGGEGGGEGPGALAEPGGDYVPEDEIPF